MYEEIQEHFPEEFALRDQDKFRYRYPKGEVITYLIIIYLSNDRKYTILFAPNVWFTYYSNMANITDSIIS